MTTANKMRRGRLRRPNGEGTVFPVDSQAGRRWDIELRDENGKRVHRRFKTEREALVALKEAQRRKEEGQEVMPAAHNVGELFDAWLEYLRQQAERGERSLTTWRGHETYVRQHMKPALGHIDCRRLSVKDVESYLAALPLSAQTRANHRATLRRALSVALKWGWVDQNVVSRTEAIRVDRREVSALSLADAQALLSALKSDRL